jgi:hypothetical protein
MLAGSYGSWHGFTSVPRTLVAILDQVVVGLGLPKAYLYDDGVFIVLDFPGAYFTQALAINNPNAYAGGGGSP